MPIVLNGSGTITGVSVGGLPDGSVDADTLAANAVTSGKLASGVGGKLLQIVQTIKTDVVSRGGSSGQDALVAISGFSVNITPSATSSKILVLVNIKQGSTAYGYARYQLYRDSTPIYLGDTVSGKTSLSSFSVVTNVFGMNFVTENFLDSPNTTSQITYQVYWGARTDSGKIAYLNRTSHDSGGYDVRTASSITAMEVAA